MAEHESDILIIGGGAGGFAAALAACSAGRRVILTEPTDWIGGQFTSQAVPPDEHRWIESGIGNTSYLELRERVRAWYWTHRSLRPEARANHRLNPGNGWVSHLCAEPRVWHAVMTDVLAPFVESGLLRIFLEHEPVGVEASGDQIECVRVRDRSGDVHTLRGKFVLDATETGDLYELGGVEHLIGAEHQRDFGELHGRADRADWRDQQGISWCFAIEHRPGETHTIDRPASYDWWRAYRPAIAREPGLAGIAWPGPLFSWTVPSHNERGRHTFRLVPDPELPRENEWEMWRYRRIVERAVHEPPMPEHPDVSLVNWVQMDYWQRPLLGVAAADRDLALREAREQSLCLLYWMQTEAPRADGSGGGYPGLRLRGDELGTADGFAKAAYIREPRRLLARTMLSEAHLGTEQRRSEGRPNMDFVPPGLSGASGALGMGESFPDAIAIGHYTLDLHPSCSGRNSVYVPAAPYRIPLGSLIPVRVRNLIAAGKGIGVTHVANGCTRMHHTEFAIGEAAGTLAAFCLQNDVSPEGVHSSAERTRAFLDRLIARGAVLRWPWEG